MLGRKLFSSGLVLGLVVSIVFPAHAELLKNFKADGSIEVRSFGIDNETDVNGAADDYRSEVNTRTMLGGSFDLLDDVHARVLLRKNNRNYGNGNGGGAGGASEDANVVQTNVFVDNAYTKIDKVFGHVDLTMGRQFYGDSNDLVIYFGPQNDEVLTVTALDTFRADASLGDWGKLQGIAGKRSDNGGVGTNSDTDVYGGQLMVDKLIPKGGLALSYYTRRIKGAGVTANDDLHVLDICVLGDVLETGLSYHADFIQDFGRNDAAAGTPAYDGNALYLGLRYGHNIAEMPFRAMLEVGRGTNDFAVVAAGKRFGKIWGEHSNAGPGTPGLTNLQVFDGGVGINPISKLGVDLNAYRFMLDDDGSTGKRSIGTEYDLIVSWKHSDNVSLEASAATFQVGDALENTAPTGTNPITRLGADIKIKF